MSERIPLPTAAVIDPVNICNLNCHLCPTGQKKLNYPQSCMSFENFKIIVSRFPELKTLELYNWGEPFLNHEIFDMINFTKENKIFTQVHTNLSLNRDDSFFRTLALNSPHKLIISLDGATPESYRTFRVRGDFDLVIENIKKIRRFQQEYGTTSFIQWKYIVNAFNEHEIPQARKIAEQIGIRVKFVPMSLGDDMIDLNQEESVETRRKKWLPIDTNYILSRYRNMMPPQSKGVCTFLFQTIVINPDGGVFPCCYATDKQYLFGNIIHERLEDIWYNEKYEHSRSLFTGNTCAGKACTTLCDCCHNFEKYNVGNNINV